ncbi:NUDIX hydrolase [Candidatus Bathycorpusculum sp.]|uniref:NUDIX hydrolase n=1 Tax=Candidatus Bathycorpusculum sp. TaxID=2994959 RepID=UPI0028342734|nr:NUDIX hydrolase [Candidatus Termitimicrobium sp.]MCL2686878.1 NUDIX hydrolase [Candidatus Termitimicrobium sp.]
MKRLYPDQPAVGIGIVIVEDQRIVLIKRDNEPARGKWTVPGGLVELGESNEEAVIREAKEETCLDVEKPLLVDVISQVDWDTEGKIRYHYVIVDYLVQVRCGNIAAASDAAELRWVPLEEVESYELTPSFRRFFDKNKEKLVKANSFVKAVS